MNEQRCEQTANLRRSDRHGTTVIRCTLPVDHAEEHSVPVLLNGVELGFALRWADRRPPPLFDAVG